MKKEVVKPLTKLRELRIKTIGDLAKEEEYNLRRIFKNQAKHLKYNLKRIY